jgi:hypothetical protein
MAFVPNDPYMHVIPAPSPATQGHKDMHDVLGHGTDVEVPFGITICSVDNMGYAKDHMVLKCNFNATAAPGAGNDQTEGYSVGSEWWDRTHGIFYKAMSVATGAASWKALNS